MKNHYGLTLLLAHMVVWDTKSLDYLLIKGANPNEKGINAHGNPTTPIHSAIQYHEYPEPYANLKRLLQEPDIDLSLTNDEGYDPS